MDTSETKEKFFPQAEKPTLKEGFTLNRRDVFNTAKFLYKFLTKTPGILAEIGKAIDEAQKELTEEEEKQKGKPKIF